MNNQGLDRLLKDIRDISLETLKAQFRNDDNFRPMTYWAIIATEETNPERMN